MTLTLSGLCRATIATGLLLVMGCGGSDDDSDQGAAEGAGDIDTPEPTSDPADVAAMIEAADLGCTDFALEPEPDELADASGECTLSDGSEINIDAFDDAQGVEAFIDYGEEVGCVIFAGKSVSYVVGEHWSISFDIEDLDADIPTQPAEDLADAIGAEADSIDC